MQSVQNRRMPNLYPVRPGEAAWAELTDHDQKVAASQLPKEQLDALDTPHLLQAALDYPLLVDAFFFNSMDEGLQVMTSSSNAFQELLARRDYSEVLLQKFHSLEPLSIQKRSERDAETYLFEAVVIETLLADEKLLHRLSASKATSALQTALAHLAQKRELPTEYGALSLGSSANLMVALVFRIDSTVISQHSELVRIRATKQPGSIAEIEYVAKIATEVLNRIGAQK